MNHSYYVALPGSVCKWARMDVGKKCPHSCRFCYYMGLPEPDGSPSEKPGSGMHKAPWRDTAQLVHQVELLAANGFNGFDLTGGEPSIHPGIFEIIKRATELGLSTRLITLGQFLTGKDDRLGKLLEAGLTDILFSYHACEAELFQKITGGKMAQIEAAMESCDKKGFQYTTNTVISNANFKHLPILARAIARRNVYQSNFLFFNAYYEWSTTEDAASVQPRYSEAAPYLREAVDTLEMSGIAVNVRFAPQCTMAGLERNLVGITSVDYDPHENMNIVEYEDMGDAERESRWKNLQRGNPSPGSQLLQEKIGGPIVGRGWEGGIAKLFAPQCQVCSAQKTCDGIDRNYLGRNSTSEFVPYVNDPRGEVLDRERLGYFAAHVIKQKPDADVRKVVRRLLHAEPLPDNPLVSVVMSCFNGEKWVAKAIQSVLAQTYPHVELIVMDNASTDNSREIIRHALGFTLHGLGGSEVMSGDTGDNNIRFRFYTENSGSSAQRHNEAIRMSRGKLVMYLDVDDWLEPSYIEEAVRQLRRFPWASFVYPGLTTFGFADELWVAAPFDVHTQLTQNLVPYCAIYRRSMYDDVGGYDEDMAIKGVADYKMWIDAIRLGHYGVNLPRQLMHYNRREDGIFETEVKPNLEKKHALVYLANKEIIPNELLVWSREKLGISRVTITAE